jgi:hypothetical protein
MKKMTLEKLYYNREVLNQKIKEKERQQRKIFRNNYANILLIMDAILIITILFNFGALIITNAMVFHAEPTTVMMEANPIASEQGGYQEHPESRLIMFMFLRHCISWVLLISFYVWRRFTLKDEKGLFFLAVILMLLCYPLWRDFLNNLGFWIGNRIWGLN